VGKLGYPDLAESALREGKADLIMLGRPLLADPEWPNKAYSGRVEEIRPCIGCQEGCINEFVEGGHPQCAVNPRSSFEHIFPAIPAPAAQKKKVAVAGAGPAGIIAAIVSARRGHEVTLYEKSGAVGGRLLAGSVAKIKYEIENYRVFLDFLVNRAVKQYGLSFRPHAELDIKALKDINADAVIFAMGTKDVKLPLPGAEKAVQAADLFLNPGLLGNAKKVVVIGGGVVGCEAAYWLRYEKNCEVTVIEMDKYIMNHTCTANRGHLIHYLQKVGVKLLNCTRLTAVTADGAEVMRNVSKTVPNPYITWHPILPENIENPLAPKLKVKEEAQIIPADLVVIAAGGVPDNGLYLEAVAANIAPELYNIGDSFSAGKILEANRAAYRLALQL
jgi:2-enoate reductase